MYFKKEDTLSLSLSSVRLVLPMPLYFGWLDVPWPLSLFSLAIYEFSGLV